MGSIQSAKSAMNFQSPGERSRCGNCRNREVLTGERISRFGQDLRCKLGGFFVLPGSICAKHEPERRAGTEVRP